MKIDEWYDEDEGGAVQLLSEGGVSAIFRGAAMLTDQREADVAVRRLAALAQEREGKVLVDRRRLVRALECYSAYTDRFYCCWPDCCWGGPGRTFDAGKRAPHSGDCPGRGSTS